MLFCGLLNTFFIHSEPNQTNVGFFHLLNCVSFVFITAWKQHTELEQHLRMGSLLN